MVNSISQIFGKGSQWFHASRKSGLDTAPQVYFEVPGHRLAVDRIASIRIDKGCVQFDRAQEPTLQIALLQDASDNRNCPGHELVFAGDQADKALDALATCGYLDGISHRVKKRVFLNARFDHQDDLSNYQAMNGYSKHSSGFH